MATYVLLTKLAPEVAGDTKHREAIGRKWKKTIAEKCPDVHFICHYALLGPYDFIDIYEAPDEEVATKVSVITRGLGATSVESWTAIEYNRFLDLMDEIS
ncbi:MAG: GYD domain-containing protein [Candidatus Eisenbacteria bacterium]